MTQPTNRPQGHCEDDRAWNQFHDDYLKRARTDLAHGEKSDFLLANAIFMADRGDWQLIGLQTAAKERIRWLSIQLATALAKVAELEARP